MEDSITLYSSPTCPKCKLLKTELSKKGIEYKECHDLDVLVSQGIKTLPVLVIEGKFLSFPEALAWVRK